MRATIKQPLSTFDKILELAGWILLLFLWCVAVFVHGKVNDLIPIHYNFAGIMSKHGDRITLLFYPATASVMFAGLTLLGKYPSVFTQEVRPGSKSLLYSLRMIRWLKISLATVFIMVIGFIYLITLGEAGDHKYLLFPSVIAIVCLPLTYYIYRIVSLKKAI